MELRAELSFDSTLRGQANGLAEDWWSGTSSSRLQETESEIRPGFSSIIPVFRDRLDQTEI